MTRAILALSVVLLGGCPDSEETPQLECAGVLCDEGQYCLQFYGGVPDSGGPDDPECTDAPASCNGTPTCDCLTECTDCTEDESGVYCEIAAP